ncbi:HAD family hydrolase [Falsihalocynthiibacter sp. SS001]|uniref:sulfotransferase-like domain-containing protein n=1 Tax=Falsihalocynthiibacter sp. SS001 TaxID=3349698 RepID=UPI0036D2854B
MRIAMWSGPRNLSTAMMYCFGARTDCAVVDEPFYGAYLKQTGLVHPMGDEIMAQMETDPDAVVAQIMGSIPDGKPHFYQKHMCHHMIEGFDRNWVVECKNVFLLRHPARVVASYAVKREEPSLADLGFAQQAEIFEQVVAIGQEPIVIDSYDIRQNPEGMIDALCRALDIPFAPEMLRWSAGGHPQDGIWADHWYGAVHKSTGFAGPEGELPKVEGDLGRVVEEAMPYYDALAAKKISVT